MFGSLRYGLAVLVLLSHLAILGPFGLNLGVSAVVVFYILAGYVISYLLTQVFVGRQLIYHFYQDRLWRILPQYYLAMLFSLLIWWLAEPKTPFLSIYPNILDWLANLFIVPLNYYMFTGQDAFTLLPPAWSLGAELQFYLIIPWLLLSVLVRSIVLAISLCIFMLAQGSVINSDTYGYRLLLGMLFIFYVGIWIQQQRRFWVAIIGLLALVYAVWLIHYQLTTSYLREVALGLGIGCLLILLLEKTKPKQAALKKLDKWLGNLSYGVFLFHFPVIWLVSYWQITQPGLTVLLVLLLSSILAHIGHYALERPLWQSYRKSYQR